MTNEEALEILKSIEILSFRDKKRKYFMRDVWKAQKVAIEALEQRWIPIKTRPMTEEEKEHFSEYADSRCDDNYTMLDCPLPDDGQEVIVSSNGYVGTDIFCRDSADGCYFEGYDIDDVDAWMSLPQPYTESEDKE